MPSRPKRMAMPMPPSKTPRPRPRRLRIQNQALTQSKDVLELRRIQVEQTKADRWNGQLPQNVYAGAPIPFFNPTNK